VTGSLHLNSYMKYYMLLDAFSISVLFHVHKMCLPHTGGAFSISTDPYLLGRVLSPRWWYNSV